VGVDGAGTAVEPLGYLRVDDAGCEANDETGDTWRSNAGLRAWAAQRDVIVVGTINAASGSAQTALVEALLDTGRPVVAVALRVPYDLAAYPAALARVLYGQARFMGRLPVSLPDRYPLGHVLERGDA
jgi:beta-N-acetylhexosaminidase